MRYLSKVMSDREATFARVVAFDGEWPKEI
jgi:hypothetical protein